MQEFSMGSRMPAALLWLLGIIFALPVRVIGIYVAAFILYWEEVAVFIFALIQCAMTLWSFILLLKSLKTVQRFSTEKAIVNLFVLWMVLVR